jgi:ubiquinone/menaquinone biosynthesis C-methylase UbiE
VATSDLFGDRADEYARIRPTYPEDLFDHLHQLVAGHELAWDCGAGSGQTARSLACRFARVIATDSSLRQLVHARAAADVHRVAAAAEAAPMRDRSADLVTVSAALHWFDRPRFYAEVRRVARPGAILAVWSYYEALVQPAVDEILMRYAEEILEPYWNPGILLNRRAYRDLDFPFERLPWPEFHAEARMRCEDMCRYMRTWSASQAWERSRGTNPVEEVREELMRAWGDPQAERVVRWPLHGAIGRVV